MVQKFLAPHEAFDTSFQLNNLASLERARRQLSEFIIAIAAHEIGHQPGPQTLVPLNIHHLEGGLMQAGGPVATAAASARFEPRTLARFRNQHEWSNDEL